MNESKRPTPLCFYHFLTSFQPRKEIYSAKSIDEKNALYKGKDRPFFVLFFKKRIDSEAFMIYYYAIRYIAKRNNRMEMTNSREFL